jgi:hypothetical protein
VPRLVAVVWNKRGWVIAILICIAAGGAAWQRSSARRAPRAVRLIDNSSDLQALLLERAGRTQAAKLPWESRSVPAADAQSLWPMPEQHFTFDEFMGYRYKSHQSYENPWPEYPGGWFEKRTNSLGLREDGELPDPRDFLVVVAGDSHTDGLCANRDGFPALLERRLASEHPRHVIEVLNTGCTGYSFHHYLGALRKFLPHDPDVFVVAFYGGNDFLDMVRAWHYFEDTSMPPRSREYWDKIERAQKIGSAGVANLFNQLLYFQFYPD